MDHPIAPGDRRMKTIAMRAAILAHHHPDRVQAVTLAELKRFAWSRLADDEQTRFQELAARCGVLADGSWDFSGLRRAEVHELVELCFRAAGDDRAA